MRLLEDIRWFESVRRWGLHLEILLEAGASCWVDERTAWFLLVDPVYPAGSIDLYPAKEGGLTATFPHQLLNGPGRAENPWRDGKLCVQPDVAVLGRNWDTEEPRTAEGRLLFYVRRTQEWLLRAASDRLREKGNYFELPDYQPRGSNLVAFAEDHHSLDLWKHCGARSGLVDLVLLDGEQKVYLPVCFRSDRGEEILGVSWGAQITEHAKPVASGIWIRTERTVVLPPWQAPTTWSELRQAFGSQGVRIDPFLERLAPSLRAHELARSQRPELLALLGFPIPERIEEEERRLHWLALKFPSLAAGVAFARGFQKNENGYRAQDRLERPPNLPLRWLKSECWNPEERGARGRLREPLRGARVLLIGAGALGSAVGELLIRGGIDRLTVIDPDVVEAGNLVRHTLDLTDLGRSKAKALAARLNRVSASAFVEGVEGAFEEEARILGSFDLVLDTTGSHDVLRALESYPWSSAPIVCSLWVGLFIRRGYCFSASSSKFSTPLCLELFKPWRERDQEESPGDEVPRDGIGCWHPVFPARADDIWLMAAILMKHVEQVVLRQESEPVLAVFEQSCDPETGPSVRRVRWDLEAE